MPEGGDYDRGPWDGHDFDAARKVYKTHAGRSYGAALKANVSHADLLPPVLRTMSRSPLVIWTDVTGSMGKWPETIFSKLPYLDHECRVYLGDDTEICFGATGDAPCGDHYPIQAQPFAKGTELAERLKGLVIEGGGGDTDQESYELAALYLARNVEMPNASRPVLIIIGDEGFYEVIDPKVADSVCHVKIQKRLMAKDVFAELMLKYSVYLIRKPYGSSGDNGPSAEDRQIHRQWADVLTEDRICMLPNADRVVDVIFGILAKETSRYPDFQKEIEGRQTPQQVNTVYESLATIHRSQVPKLTTKL
ncbi:MAG TPA: hypothetical protein VLA04_04615 [Verrucomicrobiae bacterium]|nr:hypothetical protein [Verrucomicrobiae bacterium]